MNFGAGHLLLILIGIPIALLPSIGGILGIIAYVKVRRLENSLKRNEQQLA
jgi:uncharacterized membrane protein YciS (DUF1049 family)